MKILYVTPVFLEKGKVGSGMPTYIYRMAKSLMEMGHIPIIICGGNRTKSEKFDGIEVHRINTNPLVIQNDFDEFIIENVRRDYLLQKEVRKVCQTTEIDIIQYAGNAGTGLFHSVKVPAVMRLSSYFKITYASFLTFTEWQVKLCSFLERRAAERMNAVYAPSKALALPFEEEIHRKVRIIETPFFNDAEIEDSTIYENILKGKKYFLYFGAIYPDKGVYVIADMAKRVLQKYPDYCFVFVGQDCMYKNQSTKREVVIRMGDASKSLIHIQALPHQQLYPIIKHAKLVLLPSMMENLSNSCMEAMYFGKIVVGTNGASYEQLIEDGVSGYLFSKADSASLANKIDKAMKLTEEEAVRMGSMAKKRIERLNPTIAVARTLKYYQYIIGQYRVRKQ